MRRLPKSCITVPNDAWRSVSSHAVFKALQSVNQASCFCFYQHPFVLELGYMRFRPSDMTEYCKTVCLPRHISFSSYLPISYQIVLPWYRVSDDFFELYQSEIAWYVRDDEPYNLHFIGPLRLPEPLARQHTFSRINSITPSIAIAFCDGSTEHSTSSEARGLISSFGSHVLRYCRLRTGLFNT